MTTLFVPKEVQEGETRVAATPDTVKRMARLGISVEHPNVLPVYASGEADGELWIAMRYVEGEDLRGLLATPGIGWVVTYQDPSNGWLSNHWITLHETNNIAGFKPVLVMDGWEHAFMRDYQATERAKYVDAFFKNIDWASCEGRLK